MAEPSLYEEVLAAAGSKPLIESRPPRASAAIVPWRRRGSQLEVFWVRRADSVPFMPGWHAFPGGGLAKGDAALPIDGTPGGPPWEKSALPETLRGSMLGPDIEAGLVAAGLRELLEECGLPLVTPAADAALSRILFQAAERGDLANALAQSHRRFDASRLVFAGRWLTPPFAPVRFDNRFFLLEWPENEDLQPTAASSELAHGEWIAPAEALARWHAGGLLAAPPILHLLTVLAEDGPDRGRARLWEPLEADLGPMRKIEFRPGVVLFPMATPTLPPAATTNAYLVGTGDRCILVDPGSPWDGENAALEAALEAAERQMGRRVTAIWLTHHHPDHVGGVARLRAHLGVPVAAHRATAERLARVGIGVDVLLEDGDVVDLGTNAVPFRVEVIHTPGHAQGHLSFFIGHDRTALCGDLVSAISTIVVDPPEGNMQAFLASLELLASRDPITLLPGHGPALLGGAERLRATARHRLDREARVLEAWQCGRREPPGIFELAYAGDNVPDAVRPLAYRQIRAHLERLELIGSLTAKS